MPWSRILLPFNWQCLWCSLFLISVLFWAITLTLEILCFIFLRSHVFAFMNSYFSFYASLLLVWCCSLEKCSIFWCMHLNVVLHIVSIQIVVRWRGFFDMGYNAKYVHLVVVFSVRKCGISFNYMLEHAKNLNAMYPVAGNVDILSARTTFYPLPLYNFLFHIWIVHSWSYFYCMCVCDVCLCVCICIYVCSITEIRGSNCNVIQRSQRALKAAAAAVWFTEKSSCDGNDETESCGTEQHWMTNL